MSRAGLAGPTRNAATALAVAATTLWNRGVARALSCRARPRGWAPPFAMTGVAAADADAE